MQIAFLGFITSVFNNYVTQGKPVTGIFFKAVYEFFLYIFFFFFHFRPPFCPCL